MIEAIYLIDWFRFVVFSLPTSLRKNRTVNYLSALIMPIAVLHSDFLEFRKRSLYKLTHNSQVCSIQSMLNDFYDTDLRRIRIKNADIKQPLWFYEVQDNKPNYFREENENIPVYFREASELLGGGFDFVIYVPIELKPSNETALNNYLNKMKSDVEYYKLYCKTFEIRFI